MLRALHGAVSPDYILHEMGFAEGLMLMLHEMIRQGGKFAWEGEASASERAEARARKLVMGEAQH